MLKLQQLSFAYRSGGALFTDLSLEIGAGRICGLLGANGTGKSTLLKLCAGLLFPQRGSLRVAGFTPCQRQSAFYRELMLVPEEFTLPQMTLREFVRRNAPFHPRFSRDQFTAACGAFALEPRQRLDRLSMGERKRTYLAFAFACNPSVLLLDEPTNALDLTAKRAFRQQLAMWAEPERTVVIATHQVRDIAELLDSVVILDRRGVVLNRTVDELSVQLACGPVTGKSGVIYTEQGRAGEVGLYPGVPGSESRVDLELLYNASLEQRGALTDLLNR